MGLLNRATKEELNKLREKVSEYQRRTEKFCYMIYQNLDSDGETTFNHKLSSVFGQAGTVLPLNQERLLVLLPPASDRELIAHRLSKSMKAKLLLSDEANSPESFFSHLESLS
jgi:hypothetical protein